MHTGDGIAFPVSGLETLGDDKSATNHFGRKKLEMPKFVNESLKMPEYDRDLEMRKFDRDSLDIIRRFRPLLEKTTEIKFSDTVIIFGKSKQLVLFYALGECDYIHIFFQQR